MEKKTKIINQKILYSFLMMALVNISLVSSVLSLGEQKDLEQIKHEIKDEIRLELLNVVKEEVKLELERYRQQQNQINDQAGIFANDDKIMQKVIQHVIRKVISEFETNKMIQTSIISDQELDQYQGAGAKPTLGISVGRDKSLRQPSLILAKDNTGRTNKALKTKDEDWNLVAGEQKSEAVERVLQQKGGILLLKGDMQAETSFAYSHFSSNRISVDGIVLLEVFTVGEVSTETIHRDIFIENFAIKYGLLNNFQIEAKIPFRQEHDRFVTTSGKETTDDSQGIGDVDFGVSRQITWEDGWIPDLVASLNVKSPTGRDPYNRSIGMGTGHWSVRTSLVAAKSSDPLVVFGSLSYTHNFKKNNIENYGDVKPGDSIAYSLGTVVALSYQTAINFSFNHAITMKTEMNNSVVAGSFLNIAAFKAGINWALSEKASVDMGVTIGITPHAPDVTVEIRFPIKF